MKKILFSLFSISALLATQSCKTDFDTDVTDVVVSKGDADFTKYISIGNSLTSGFRDNALYIDGQNESYPSMIAQQMKLAGGGSFTQPMMNDNNGGLMLGTTAIQGTKMYIKAFVNGSPVLANIEAAPTTDVTKKLTGTINNMGVPGAKSYHLIAPGYGSLANLATGKSNPYFVRFATSETTTVADDAAAQKPTFFSLWIGNNDVLSYATSGGAGVDQAGNTNPATYGPNDISDPNVVAGSIKTVLEKLKANGSTKGIIANIPYVTSIPYFTTVPYNPLTPALLGSNITALNTSIYGPLKQVLSAYGQGSRINLLSSTATNPLLIKDTSLQNYGDEIRNALTPAIGIAAATAYGQLYGQARQATKEDYVVLTASSIIGTPNAAAPAQLNVNGISFPLENQYVLTKTEAAKVKTATDAYNAAISGLATQYSLAFVDANKKMIELNNASGIQFNGVKYNAKFVTGGTFSLDGVHLTGRGYAIVANEFIKSINEKYKSTLPIVNVNAYSGVKFP